MNRTEFIIATSIILFVAFMLGWFCHWLLHRFAHVAPEKMTDLDRMAQEVHDAEEQRDEAIAWARERETELLRALSQSQAEARAAMEGLRDARAEVDALRDR